MVVETPTWQQSHAYLQQIIEDKRMELNMNLLESETLTMPLSAEICTFLENRVKCVTFAEMSLDMITSNKHFLSYTSQYFPIAKMYETVNNKFKELLNKLLPLAAKIQDIEPRTYETLLRNTAEMSIEELLNVMPWLDADINSSSDLTTGFSNLMKEWNDPKVDLLGVIQDCALKMFNLAKDLHQALSVSSNVADGEV
ncbi:unnamed protein product [Orchesella dallaii]|uniref:Uncharacterized protein n=1 Tax=Orchesella dallaii TaxID=48710 RepID=A0ABP1QLH4_9HEXA